MRSSLLPSRLLQLTPTERQQPQPKRFSIAAGSTPSAPTGVSAEDNSSTEITVEWTELVSGGGSTITQYNIQWRERHINASFTEVEDVDSPHQFTGLDPATDYEFAVSAVNGLGEGSSSTPVQESTPAGVPDAPTISLSLGTNYTDIVVDFTDPSDTGGSAITQYDARYTTSSGLTYTTSNNIGDGGSITGLQSHTTYRVQGRVRNADETSDWTSDVTISTSSDVDPVAPEHDDDTATVGQSYSRTLIIAVTGNQPLSYAVSGLPAGIII